MLRWTIALTAAVVLSCGSAEAQIGAIAPTTPFAVGPGSSVAASSPDSSSPLGVTSPLGMSLSVPVGPVGIPLGATELAIPGGTPSAKGAVPQALPTGSGLGSRSNASVGRVGIPLGATELSPGGQSPP
jgi:hypothetical protein